MTAVDSLLGREPGLVEAHHFVLAAQMPEKVPTFQDVESGVWGRHGNARRCLKQ